jgi:malonyl-CoA O-methyltransferase
MAFSSRLIANRKSTIVNPFEAHQLWAEQYDTAPNPMLSLEERCLSSLLPDLTDLRIADLGCGTGRGLARLRDAGAKFCFGVDFSPAMLARAARKPAIGNCLVQADLQRVPLRAGSIDLVFCSFVLGYVKSLELLVCELGRILRAGGRVLCADVHPRALKLGWKRSFRSADGTVEIEASPYSIEEILTCVARVLSVGSQRTLYFGEPERSVFDQAGKAHLFEEARQVPAVILFEWFKPAE